MTAPKTNSGEPKDTIFEMVLMGNVMPSDGLLRLSRLSKHGKSIIDGHEDDGRWLAIKAGFAMDWSRGPRVTHENYLTDWRLFIDLEKITCRFAYDTLKYHNFRCYTAKRAFLLSV
jgi:hypothetical protein